MRKEIKFQNGIHGEIFLPERSKTLSLIYMHEPAPDNIVRIWEGIKRPDLGIISIAGLNWNRDMTPWPAPKVFNKESGFTGGADRYLRQLTLAIIPEIEKKLQITPVQRSIAGYSLGGLFALYALFNTDIFDSAASISGSLWFDGWVDYISQNRLKKTNYPVYISIGDEEKITRNERMARVEQKTFQTAGILKEQGADVYLEINQGNHFTHMEERIIRALQWLGGDRTDNTPGLSKPVSSCSIK